VTFYQQQVFKIRDKLYPKEYLTARLIKAKLFMDQNYDRPIDLTAIAEASHFSKFHFIRQFKLFYGKTPHQYLTMIRIEKAKCLLRSQEAVSSVYFQLGFDSISSFTGLFKKMTGNTPSAYQNRYARSIPFNTAPLPGIGFFVP
jgi:AraC-like DNA-binding protein